ncbi:hypothetical protein IJF81_00355, partial [bacterium]|nr:hypothetical protein [bacterium]
DSINFNTDTSLTRVGYQQNPKIKNNPTKPPNIPKTKSMFELPNNNMPVKPMMADFDPPKQSEPKAGEGENPNEINNQGHVTPGNQKITNPEDLSTDDKNVGTSEEPGK